jgi:peptidoglycan/xylan/chitin deacetylase (PgdA/CDA1 family)
MKHMVHFSTADRSCIPILTYHQIAPVTAKGTPYRSLCVAPENFSRQMRFLQLLGYRGLSMSDLMPYLRAEKRGRVIGITFDDGYVNNLTYAAPVLQTLGFSSTCYAVSQLLGKTNIWDKDIGIPQVPLMSAMQLQQWVAFGQEVGAHTRNHVHLNALDPTVSRQEIALCKTELEVASASPVMHFCYPYGEYGADHVGMVSEAGYQSATTTQRSRCGLADNLFELPRAPVARRTSLFGLWLKVATGYEDRKRV